MQALKGRAVEGDDRGAQALLMPVAHILEYVGWDHGPAHRRERAAGLKLLKVLKQLGQGHLLNRRIHMDLGC